MRTSPINLLAFYSSLMFFSVAYGHDDHGHAHDHAHGAEHQHATASETLAFRLLEWKDMQFTDHVLAQQHFDAVQNLGCEVRMDNSAGGTSVSYRCSEWKPLELANHELAQQWATWLIAAGFDCSHGHIDPVMLTGPEVVEFRVLEWQTVHSQPADLAAVIASLELVGCEVRQSQHGEHVDVAYRCPLWRDIHLENHSVAERWIGFLEQHAFEVRHEHE